MDPDLFIDTEDPDELFCFDFKKTRGALGTHMAGTKIMEEVAVRIEELICNKQIPCRTISEYLRWAAYYGLKVLAKRVQSSALSAYITDEETEFKEKFFTAKLERLNSRGPIISKRIALLLEEGDALVMRDYIVEELKYVNSQPSEWRKRYIKILQGATYIHNALSLIEEKLSSEDQEFIATTLKLWRNEGLWN
uniref:Uncharacterized protein n=1 Tax=viral metagenome TaxID=1070528 RepID=A0A6M3LFJ4_9ZZZZ